MDTYFFFILISLSFCLFLKAILNLSIPKRKRPNCPLPPGPPTIPIIGNFLWLRKSFSELEPILRSFHARFGPIVTVHIGSRPAIFVADRSLAHQALVQNGAVFADRPPPLATGRIDSTDQHNISSAFYGPTWRLLRRNLTSEILHPSRVKSYSHARHCVLQLLVDRLKSEKSNPTQGVVVVDHLRYAMFCLLVLMCIGDEAGEEEITKIEEAQRRLLLNLDRYNTLNFWPALTKILFKRRWEEYIEIRRNQEDVLVPLIRARKEAKRGSERRMVSYVDTLLELELPEEGKRKLNEAEMVSLCSEFLNAGTDTTTTALQWIMASLVKYPKVQEKLYSEIKKVMEDSHNGGGGEGEVEEEYLPKMKYLKAVVLEGLRRHPPAHFLLPHAVAEDTELGGYLVPKGGTINFMVAEMGWDPRVWEDPMEFKPERFLGREGREIDLTGSKDVKMMPFGVGRRICPGYVLALLHLEYFVANLVWRFKWGPADGDAVDMSEKQEFTMVMKYPLLAKLSARTS